jgi:glycosyltransferase involved in cell wall biosynthesis
MRILVLMNMYPPFHDGGYPLDCQEAVTELRKRGHDVLVLTSNRGLDGRRAVGDGVWRIFEYCPSNETNRLASTSVADVWRWYRREWIEHTLLRRALDEHRPELVWIWTTKGLSHSLAICLARHPVPFCAYVCGYFIKPHNLAAPMLKQYQIWRWKEGGKLSALVKRLLRALLARRIPLNHEPLLFDAVAFNTRRIAEEHAGLAISRTAPRQIADSVPVERFAAYPPPDLSRPRKVLFLGRLHPSKDPLTLIRACAQLQKEPATRDLQLTLVGWRHDPDYAKQVEAAIAAAPLPAQFRIDDPVDYAAVPALLARHEILVVPSQVDPLPRAAAEGMAAGLAVVLSANAGISELVVDGQHALIFSAGKVSALAQILRDVVLDPNLAQRLQREGRKHAQMYFSTKRMVDEMESFLADVLAAPHPVSRSQARPLLTEDTFVINASRRAT